MARLGQHFLHDKGVLDAIADKIPYEPGATIIEIGPGHGELTKKIRDRWKQAPIVSLERDLQLAACLREEFSSDPNFSLVEGNALEELPKLTKRLRASFYIVGNIPYYITGHLFRVIGGLSKLPKGLLFLIQKEVAERIAAKPPHMNRLAASIQPWATPTILFGVGKQAFNPAPKVESAVIELSIGGLTALKQRNEYYKILSHIFAQPRKTLLNNLSSLERNKDILREKLIELKIDPARRPESLSIEEILRISKTFR